MRTWATRSGASPVLAARSRAAEVRADSSDSGRQLTSGPWAESAARKRASTRSARSPDNLPATSRLSRPLALSSACPSRARSRALPAPAASVPRAPRSTPTYGSKRIRSRRNSKIRCASKPSASAAARTSEGSAPGRSSSSSAAWTNPAPSVFGSGWNTEDCCRCSYVATGAAASAAAKDSSDRAGVVGARAPGVVPAAGNIAIRMRPARPPRSSTVTASSATRATMATSAGPNTARLEGEGDGVSGRPPEVGIHVWSPWSRCSSPRVSTSKAPRSARPCRTRPSRSP